MNRLLLILSGLLAASGQAAISPARMSAPQLLDEFAKTRDKLKSFIAHTEFRSQDDNTVISAWKGEMLGESETRSDGHRIYCRTLFWGVNGPGEVRTRDQGVYHSRLWDGECCYDYLRSTNNGTLTLQRDQPPPRATQLLRYGNSPLSECLGLVCAGCDRIDVILGQASALRVRNQMEAAGWEPSPCYVLEGQTRYGKVTLWLDPAHGFHIARALSITRSGDVGNDLAGYRLMEGERTVRSIEKVRFAKSGGVWMPMEVISSSEATFPKGEHSIRRGHLKVTRFVLNPDHERLRSFLPDDIRNEALALIWDANRAGGGFIHYQWRDGRIVDKDRNVVFDSGLKNANTGQPIPSGKK